MSSFPKSDADVDRSLIAALRKAWIEAVVGSDVDRLTTLVTDDVVAVHGNGHCACGKEEFRRDFLQALAHVDVERAVPCSDFVLHGRWAIAIDEVESTRLLEGSDRPLDTHFGAVFVFQRQSDDSWKVARVMELLG